MMMRTLTLLLLATGASAATDAPKSKLDEKAIRLIDSSTNTMYNFHDFKGVHVYSGQSSNDEKTYRAVKKRVDAVKPNSSPAPMKGNPASSFCDDQLKGKNRTLTDLVGNEYAICEFEDKTMVDAWDVFRLKPEAPTTDRAKSKSKARKK